MRSTLVAVAMAAVVATPTLVACSKPGTGTGTGTGLVHALERVAATDNTRGYVSYSDTGGLVKLVGKQPAAATGYADVRAVGAADLAPYESATDQTGIALYDANYTLSAGAPPTQVALVGGGQNADRVRAALTKLGWKQDGDKLAAPGLSNVGGDVNVVTYALILAQVRADGGDVVYGGRQANLGEAGKPSGHTLADDPVIGALAGCLGDVVASMIDGRPKVAKLAAVAIGVRRPTSASDTPHVAVCTSWIDQAAADAFADKLPDTLASGVSLRTRAKYSQLLKNPSTKRDGGDTHVVSWQADAPGPALRIFQLLQARDLPGLAG